jgi:hypothetical protein
LDIYRDFAYCVNNPGMTVGISDIPERFPDVKTDSPRRDCRGNPWQ